MSEIDEKALAVVQDRFAVTSGKYKDMSIREIIEAYEAAKTPERESGCAEIDAGFWEGEYKSIVRAAVEKMAELGHEVDPPEKLIDEAKYRLSRIHDKRNEIEVDKPQEGEAV